METTAVRAIQIGASVVAIGIGFKYMYVRYWRKDVPVNAERFPVLGMLKKPVHASHRGGSHIWPENTMFAMRKAIFGQDGDRRPGNGTSIIEFDVQKSADGQLILMHNEQVDATTNGTGLVAKMTLAELRQLDAGYNFTVDNGVNFPYRGKGLQVPLLREVLTEFAPVEDLVFYIDFKSADAVPDTLLMVKEFNIERRTIMGAVPPAANRELRRLKPDSIPLTPDHKTMITMYLLYLLGLLWFYPMKHEIVGTTVYRWGRRVLTAGMLKAFHDRGRLMAVFGEHLDTPEGQRDCIHLGVDFLFSDRPDILHKTLNERQTYEPLIANRIT